MRAQHSITLFIRGVDKLLILTESDFGGTLTEQLSTHIVRLSAAGLSRLTSDGIPVDRLEALEGQMIEQAMPFRDTVRQRLNLSRDREDSVIATAELYPTEVTPEKIRTLDEGYLKPDRMAAVKALVGRSFATNGRSGWHWRSSPSPERKNPGDRWIAITTSN